MATSNPTMPLPNMPELGYGSWPNATAPQVGLGSRPTATAPQVGFGSRPTATAPQVGYGTWPNVNLPPRSFDPGPIVAAPMPPPVLQPVLKAPRTGRTIAAWSLSMLAIGLAAGPLLAEYVDQGLETGMEWLANSVPSFLKPYFPKPIEASASQSQASSVAREISATPAAVEPARPAAEKPEPTPEVAAPTAEAKAPVAAAATKAIQPERPMGQSQTRKTRGTNRRTVTLAKAESAAAKPAGKSARRPRGEQSDPWATEETGAKAAAVSERPAKATAEPAAVKSRPAKSGDSLDDLMAGAASASQPKDRRKSSREIDDMLQEVQKSHPAPRPARAEPEALPSLTASDIAKAMAGVKTNARACGKRFGQSGVADLRLAVGKDGKVTDAAVRGKLAGSSLADCITQAAHAASFPPNSGLKFNYRIDVQ